MTLCTHREKKHEKISSLTVEEKPKKIVKNGAFYNDFSLLFSRYTRTFEDLSILKFNRDDERKSEGEQKKIVDEF